MRGLVVVSGAPGAGKSTLATPLARALGFPLLAKDIIKETLHDALGDVRDDPLVSSRLLGAAAMELLWTLAAECPAVVIEANFRSASDYERVRIRRLTDRPVEVYCRVPVEVAAARYSRRGALDSHHPVHVLRSLPLDAFESFQHPMGVGSVIEVDTTEAVDVDELARQVEALLSA